MAKLLLALGDSYAVRLHDSLCISARTADSNEYVDHRTFQTVSKQSDISEHLEVPTFENVSHFTIHPEVGIAVPVEVRC
jgi:hypothetical protein